jgi:5-methyltetrahydrofolate--homocysteine methyltransferase
MSDFIQRLGREWLFWDGGTGTILQSWGLAAGELPERWNLDHPDKIVELHRQYYEAGCDIVNTNTFGANALKYPDDLEAVVTAAVRHVQEARRLCGRQDDGYVALDLGPTGRLLAPTGDLPFEEAVDLFKQVVRIGAAAGADLVLIETMTDSYEAKAAVLAAKEACDLPVCCTVSFDKSGKMLLGGTPETVVPMLEGLGVAALGINCSLGPEQMVPLARRMAECASVPVIITPNAGLPRNVDGHDVYDLTPEEYTYYMKQIAACGVQVLGGCCGTTPDYMRSVIDAVLDLPFVPQTLKHGTVVTSHAIAVEIGKGPVVIGERINPTGKKAFKEALRKGDVDYILSEGLKQEDAGAQILDVNVGLPEIDEPAMIEAVVTRLQAVCALPLQIDTSDAQAMEQAMRHYNGKPMINSVNGSRESMAKVFPLVKKYGGVVVALALDENGIPNDADGRIRVAEKIYQAASAWGIRKEDIVIDGLAMTVSSDAAGALVTLETLRRVRDQLAGHSILGVSNISFGLPRREIINAHFLTMAMQAGLDCAIINPLSQPMMDSWRAYRALTQLDENFTGYIAAYADSGQPSQAAPAKAGAPGLYACIRRGLDQAAAEATRLALQDRDGLTIINEELIPALDEVGQGFEAGTIFLPQLLMSAEAAKAAFAVIKDSMAGKPQETKGRVILATVKGDIHDIGKNIVKVMLENYGYDVIDLGKDVPPETIVDCAIENDIRVVGLSALMTTTVVNMAETIRQLRQKKPDTLVCVGGAVMTQEYADQIGADFYGKDAMATVRFCDSVFEEK